MRNTNDIKTTYLTDIEKPYVGEGFGYGFGFDDSYGNFTVPGCGEVSGCGFGCGCGLCSDDGTGSRWGDGFGYGSDEEFIVGY